MAYIPFDKMKSLREAAKKGDERAKKILIMQMDGADFGSSLEEYFAAPQPQEQPKPQPAAAPMPGHKIDDPKLAKFLEYNGVSEGDPDYESTIEAYYQEFPKARPAEMKATESHSGPSDDGINIPSTPGDNESIYGDEDEDDAPQAATEQKDCIDSLIDSEYEAIKEYNEAISDVMRMDLGDAVKRGMIADLEEIRKDEMEHVDKLKRMKESVNKKEEKAEEAAQPSENMQETPQTIE